MNNKSTLNPEDIKLMCNHIREQIGRVVVGYENVVDDLLVCLIAKGHLFMIGVPGIAKTTLAKTFSESTGLSWNRVQFTQDLLPSDILGHYYFNQKNNTFELRRGPVFGEIILADEINRATPKTQSALIEAMQERQVTIEGSTFPLPEPFLVIATKNPVETEGVYPLPEAQLDRFLYSVQMDYLPTEQELKMLHQKNDINVNNEVSLDPISNVKDLVDRHHQVYADKSIVTYIMNIINETRNNNQILMGASPRAGEHMLYAAKAYALIHGRDYVIPDYIKYIAPKILRHRLILSTESEFEGISIEKLIDDIISSIEIPDFVKPEIVTE
jgi:MoxR-like ATPase